MATRSLFLAALLLGLVLSSGCLGFGEDPGPAPAPSYNASPLPSASPLKPGQPVPTRPGAPPAQPAPASFEMSFLNVSLGDATLIQTPQAVVLFDAGGAEMGSRVSRALRDRGVERIHLLVLSSSDPAFAGGAPRVLQDFPVDEIWITGVNYTDLTWDAIVPYLPPNKTHAVRYGDSKSFGPLTVQALNPQKKLFLTSPEADSIVLKVSYGSFCSLLFSNSVAAGASGSDAGTVFGGVDNAIISGSIPVECQVLKVSAHGSANAASFQLLEKAKPENAVISVGPNPPDNLYPQPALLRRLILRDAQVWTTDKLGTITVTSDGTGYGMASEKLRDATYGKFLEDVANRGANYWTAPLKRR